MRVGDGEPSGFILRDSTGDNQYADGMSLYQQALGNPTVQIDPMGLSSRKTKYWHARALGVQKIKSGFGEIEHSVISVNLSRTEGLIMGLPTRKAAREAREGRRPCLAFVGDDGQTDPSWQFFSRWITRGQARSGNYAQRCWNHEGSDEWERHKMPMCH
jgi:hypothetical protein